METGVNDKLRYLPGDVVPDAGDLRLREGMAPGVDIRAWLSVRPRFSPPIPPVSVGIRSDTPSVYCRVARPRLPPESVGQSTVLVSVGVRLRHDVPVELVQTPRDLGVLTISENKL